MVSSLGGPAAWQAKDQGQGVYPHCVCISSQSALLHERSHAAILPGAPLPPELVSSEDIRLLVLTPVKGSVYSLDIRGQPQAGEWLGVPSLQGAGRIDPVLIP